MWLIFIVIGGILSLLLWVFQRKKLSYLIKFATILVLISILGIFIFLNTEGVFLGDVKWYDKNIVREFILFIMMLMGMSARYITILIEQRQEKIKSLRKKKKDFEKPKIEFDVWEFSYPMFISVITFGVLLKQLESNSITITNIVISFQNGFFWQTLLKKESK